MFNYYNLVTMVTVRSPDETQQQTVGYTGSVMGSTSSAVNPSLSQSKHRLLSWGYAASAMVRTCRRAWLS